MTSIQLKTPWGDTVVLKNTGAFDVVEWGRDGGLGINRMCQIENWLNLEWWPTVFDPDWYQLKVEDFTNLPERI